MTRHRTRHHRGDRSMSETETKETAIVFDRYVRSEGRPMWHGVRADDSYQRTGCGMTLVPTDVFASSAELAAMGDQPYCSRCARYEHKRTPSLNSSKEAPVVTATNPPWPPNEDETERQVGLLRGAGCTCSPPLLGYRPGVGPRCRLCNRVASDSGSTSGAPDVR